MILLQEPPTYRILTIFCEFCMCVFICMYVRVCVCVCVCVYVCVHMCFCMCVRCMYTCVYVCNVRTCVYVWLELEIMRLCQ